jgi:hypothetical protein
MIDTLQLRNAIHPNGQGQYWDFYVNGRRLADRLETQGDIPPFGWVTVDFDRMSRRLLLLEEPFGYERARLPLYVCHLCADYLCGFFSASIVREGDRIIWSNFAMARYDYEATDEADPFIYTQNKNAEWMRLSFDVNQYRSAILEGMPSA